MDVLKPTSKWEKKSKNKNTNNNKKYTPRRKIEFDQ